jgi:hypothetical protein
LQHVKLQAGFIALKFDTANCAEISTPQNGNVGIERLNTLQQERGAKTTAAYLVLQRGGCDLDADLAKRR